jgi:hypothetical protein
VKDKLYIKTFVINQPMVSPLGYWANRYMPDWFWVQSL